MDPELASRVEALEGRSDEELRAGLSMLGARLEAVEGRTDEELQSRIESATVRLDELTARPIADPALPNRLAELERRHAEDASAAEHRLDEAFGVLAARADELRAAEDEARSGLDEAMRRLEALDAAVPRLDEIEQRLAEVVDARAEDAAAAILWRAVDRLRGRTEQTLSLLGQVGERLEELEAAVRGGRERAPGPAAPRPEVERHIETASEETASEPARAAEHVLFAPTGEGYELVAREGAPPSAGQSVELPLVRGPLVVARLGRSPLPGDARPCAFLERVTD